MVHQLHRSDQLPLLGSSFASTPSQSYYNGGCIGGVVHGMWTHRWAGDSARDAGIDLLAKVDAPLGDWQPGPATPVNERDIPKVTQATSRQFLNEKANKRAVASVFEASLRRRRGTAKAVARPGFRPCNQ